MIARLERHDMSAKRDSPERALAMLAKEPIEATDAKEPTLPMDKAEPIEAMDSTDPFEAIERVES